MKKALVIRHLPFENLGSFERVLQQEGFDIGQLEAGLDDLASVDPAEPDLLVVLGGPIGAYQEESYPFLIDELHLLEERLARDLPTLGICLGSQLMARTLGAGVYPGAHKEIGWSALQLSAAGEEGPLRYLGPDGVQVLHWHGDTFDLPAGAQLLASSDLYENQAFSWGRRGLALQFHPEVTVRGLEQWYIGHTNEIAATPDVTVPGLRRDAELWGPRLETQGPLFLAAWLQAVSLKD